MQDSTRPIHPAGSLLPIFGCLPVCSPSALIAQMLKKKTGYIPVEFLPPPPANEFDVEFVSSSSGSKR